MPADTLADPAAPSGLELACALRDGAVSSRTLTEQALSRIEAVNDALAAFVRLTPSRALRAADRADRALAAGAPGVFFGVPTGIKDIEITAFDTTTFGSRAWRWFWSPFDGAIAKRMRQDGMVVLGKLATSELAVMSVTETDIHPPCRNPWDTSRSAGGSSGGSGSAVASGMLPIANASDGGGSIRIPAAFCGLFGFKPSVGLLPDYYGAFDPIGMGQPNALTRTVDDAAAMLDVMRGRVYDPRDPAADTLLAQGRERPPRLRIALTTASPLTPVDPERAAAAERVAARLTELGHTVEARPMIDAGVRDFLPVFGHVLSRPPVFRERLLQPATRYVRDAGRQVSRSDATRLGLALRERVVSWFGDFDLWLMPTTACAPPPVGAWRGLSGEEAFQAAIPTGAFTAVFNVGGQAAASVPAGFDAQGLPIGVQLAAPIGNDALLLKVCRELEAAMPWRTIG